MPLAGKKQLTWRTDSTQEAPFTHVLLVSQDVDFTAEDLDALIAAKLPIVAGVGLTKHVPYFPNFIPSFTAASAALQGRGGQPPLNSFETPEGEHTWHAPSPLQSLTHCRVS